MEQVQSGDDPAPRCYPVMRWWWQQPHGSPTGFGEANRFYGSIRLWPGYVHDFVDRTDTRISKWTVSMDVADFCPAEISLGVRGGILEVRGEHEERADPHGSIARCFTRKYRLPDEADVTKMVASLSLDGVLKVEVPVPEASVPAPTFIPIQIETGGYEKSDGDGDDNGGEPGPTVEAVQGEEPGETCPLAAAGEAGGGGERQDEAERDVQSEEKPEEHDPEQESTE